MTETRTDRFVEALIASRGRLMADTMPPRRKADAEGGCGVIGIACTEPIAGRHLLPALTQMRNRGNGKGGGTAAVGLDPSFFDARPGLLQRDYLLAVALLDSDVRTRLEREFIAPTFDIDHAFEIRGLSDFRRLPGLDVQPPQVLCYFVRVRPSVQRQWAERHNLAAADPPYVDDEIVYQNTYCLNRALYASTGDKQAFVLSHGKDLLALKMIGYGDDVLRYYGLEDLRAHVWIGHHRYPTRGKVWHPGGAHPFVGVHEALVHNGDFANYASICSYLAQRNIHPLFLTDTEVAVLVFDLLHRVYGYPLEYVFEAMAPTTERDLGLLPPDRRQIYEALQAVHMHGSPDGPWFFLVAQSAASAGACRLIGITDTSMLRPQVFAMQSGEASIGFAASEKQAIDAALESLAGDDARFWPRADLYWNARGGSHTDGGAFLFSVQRRDGSAATLTCTDKFGRTIAADPAKEPPRASGHMPSADARRLAEAVASGEESFAAIARAVPRWTYPSLDVFLDVLARDDGSHELEAKRRRAIDVLTSLLDHAGSSGCMKPSVIRARVDAALARVFEAIRHRPSADFAWMGASGQISDLLDAHTILVVEARGFAAEGRHSLARALVTLVHRGARRLIVANARGHRFIGCGLGPHTDGVRIDVYGSSGDYLASGIDGAEIIVHGSGQDQLGQIMKAGRLVVYGDVGQTFMYAAKGGAVFVLGNAAGRPLINAAGRPRVIINGTCLDYLAESFMAGDPLNGGGFVVLNGVTFGEDGAILERDTPFPGGNLFSLASGGAIYVRDPQQQVGDDQLNGGMFAPLTPADWAVIQPYLEENARWFGIPVERLLEVKGRPAPPVAVFRKIAPAGHKALAPEEAWVRPHA